MTLGISAQELRGMKNLAGAVIRAAFEDAKNISKDGGVKAETSASRLFLLGGSKAWRESLQIWCDIAELEPEYVIRLAKKCDWYEDYLHPKPKSETKKVRRKKNGKVEN